MPRSKYVYTQKKNNKKFDFCWNQKGKYVFFYLFDFSIKKISIIKVNLYAKYSYFTIKNCLFADVAFYIEEKENFFNTKIIVNNGGDYKTTWIYICCLKVIFHIEKLLKAK